MGRESTRKVLTLRARAQSRPPREIHYSHCHTTFPFWMDFDSSVRKTIIKRVFALYANFASLGLNGCFFVHVPKWMVKSTNMSSFLPFLQHPDMKKKVSRRSLSLLLFSKISSIQKIDCKIFDEGDENFNLLLFVSSICV